MRLERREREHTNQRLSEVSANISERREFHFETSFMKLDETIKIYTAEHHGKCSVGYTVELKS